MRAGWTLDEMTRHAPRDWRFSREDAAHLVNGSTRAAPVDVAVARAAARRADDDDRSSLDTCHHP